MCALPVLFTPLKPIINSGGFNGVGVLGEKRGLVPQHALEKCELHSGVMVRILGVFSPWEKVGPVVLVLSRKYPQEVPYLQFHMFNLPIDLRVVFQE